MIRTLLVAAVLYGAPANAADRILSIGGSVTEIVFALGAEDRLVARDTTSSFPDGAEALPDVGYMRALSPEGVLSVAPTLILAEEGAGPPETIEVLESASIPIVFVSDDPSAEGIAAKVTIIGDALGLVDKAAALNAKIKASLDAATARARVVAGDQPKRVLFILSTQGGRILASGTNTAANAIIGLAGGINAVDAFEGYKPLTDEAVVAAAPDVILMMDRGGDHGAATGELIAMPAIATTPAASTRSVVRMDGLFLLGFGPRTANAVSDLSRALYGG